MTTPAHRIAPRHAAILCVGTELTSGQILNRNASSLSERLTDLGVEVRLHETVPDDRELILEALERCEANARLIVVTGGLGPTTDDFTREILAQWSNRELEFHQPSLDYIQERLARIGIASVPSQRQQCYYPRGSRVLHNSEGTAHGFSFDKGEARVWVLPGPPREIDAIWKGNGLDAEIRSLLPDTKPRRLFRYQCLGRGEADIGETTERAVAGSQLLTGYRLHRPYVEVKVWCDEAYLPEAKPYLEKLEEALAPWIAARDDQDLGREVLQELARYDEVEILDCATGGMLARRLGDLLAAEPASNPAGERIHIASDWAIPAEPEAWVTRALEEADSDEEIVTLAIAGFSPEGTWALGMRDGSKTVRKALQLPYRSKEGPQRNERSRAYATEMTLKLWRDWLKAELN